MMIAGLILGFIGMMWLMLEMEDRSQWRVFFIFLLIWVGGGLFRA